jgi:diguanylate cyclase (GGDEF)-like protein
MNVNLYIIWNNRGYFIIHLLLLLLSIIGFCLTKKAIKNITVKWEKIYYYYTCSILIVYLILISIISALDQLQFNNISSLFIANLLICGGIFLLNFPKNIITFIIPFASYSVSLFYFKYKSTEVLPNVLNGAIFLVAMVIISCIIYNYQYEIIAKNIILQNNITHLNYISNHDSLTGLINRRYFMEQLKIRQVGCSKPSSIILADVDHFKHINDFYGHPVGDEVLKEISTVILKSINEDDMAVRWGGEEFLLFLDNTSLEDAYVFTNTLRKNIERLNIQHENFNINVTVSFGVSLLKSYENNSFNDSYKIVDKALYQAKEQGRNCVVRANITDKFHQK